MFLWCSNFCFIQTRYHHSFCPAMEFFCNCIKHQITVETSGLSAPNECVIPGGPGHGPLEIFLKIGPWESPYPAFTGSNAVNSCVYFVELFSESRYFWFPSRSTKFMISQVFKTKIHDSYMFCYYNSWFMIPLPPRLLEIRDFSRARRLLVARQVTMAGLSERNLTHNRTCIKDMVKKLLYLTLHLWIDWIMNLDSSSFFLPFSLSLQPSLLLPCHQSLVPLFFFHTKIFIKIPET